MCGSLSVRWRHVDHEVVLDASDVEGQAATLEASARTAGMRAHEIGLTFCSPHEKKMSGRDGLDARVTK